jgi:hypothetical protein
MTAMLEFPKAIKFESLNQPLIDSEGHITELGELVTDESLTVINKCNTDFVAEVTAKMLDITTKSNNPALNLISHNWFLLYKYNSPEAVLIITSLS